jgi:hypothetical protein
VITKPQQHDVNRAGKRLLRVVLEPLGWVVNDVQEDYGIDCIVQVFDRRSPTGAWFHVQLKSSASSEYAADQTFISQELSIGHARHYALELREPVFVIHADVTRKSVYWYAPQLDGQLEGVLGKTGVKSTTVRIPTRQKLPETVPDLLTILNKVHLKLAIREFVSATPQTFAESLKHLPDQQALHRAFQEKNDSLKLQRVHILFAQRKFDEARSRAEVLLADPDSTVETKFWSQIQLQKIDWAVTHHSGKPQNELHRVTLAHAKVLQKLVASGPKHLKFYALIARHAAELEILVHENLSLSMALRLHLQSHGDPMMILGLYARRSALTRLIASKYNRCVRLARYAANYPDRWVLGRALTTVVDAIGPYLITLHSESNFEAERAFAHSALQICKLSAWIGDETGDTTTVVMAIMGALLTVRTEDSDAYRWADQTARSLSDPEVRADALLRIERAVKRWKGERLEGDYQGDTVWQAIQNIATALGIDMTNENDPLVRGLRIAAKDESPERVLAHCEHLLVSLGATGPTARRIAQLFSISTAGSKVIHCTLHD